MAGAEETGKYQSCSPMQGAMGLGIKGRRQVEPRWKNDTVWQHDSGNGIEDRGRCGYPTLGGKYTEGGEVRRGLRRVAYVTINDVS